MPRDVREAIDTAAEYGWPSERPSLLLRAMTMIGPYLGLNPAWLTPNVLALATGIYADNAFDRMPILADALEEAGCDNTYVLGHCRGSWTHVRGCWVVDLLLGKS
jgi:hypothetical protein